MTEPNIISITKPLKLSITKEVNGLWYGDLEIKPNDYISTENYVEVENDLCITRKVNKTKDKGKPCFLIRLEHIMSELNNFSVAPFDYTNETPINIMTYILGSSDWTIGTVDFLSGIDLKSDKRISALKALNLLAEKCIGELYFNTPKQIDGSFLRIIDLKTAIGNVTELQIRYDKNSDYIERQEDSTSLCTRFYIYGKDNITIESVSPGGLPYLDSVYIGNYKYVKEQTMYTNIVTPANLLIYAQAYLALYEIPILTYKSNVIDLSTIYKWKDEIIGLGDTLRVYDNVLKINVKVRVRKTTKDYNLGNIYIELSNNFEIGEKTLANLLSRLTSIISDIINQNDETISTEAIKNALEGSTEAIEDALEGSSISKGAFVLYIGGMLQTGYYQGPIVHVPFPCRVYELWCYVAWKPTEGDVVIRCNKTGINIGEVTILQGEYVAPGEGEVGAGASIFIDEPMVLNDLLNIDILGTDGVAQRLTVEYRYEK